MHANQKNIPPSIPLEERSDEEKLSAERKKLRTSRMMVYYILAAEKLLRENGLKDITIRKISQEAGFSSGTLYTYFKDLDELILFASMKYRKEYVKRLSEEILSSMNALEQYRRIYELFNYYTFRSPEIFMNMFFGKHSGNLREIAKIYYELFPEEKSGQYTPLVRDLLTQGDIFNCDRSIMRCVVEEGFVREENVESVINILVRVHESYMYDLILNPQKDPDAQSAEFMRTFEHVMRTN